MRNVSKYTLSAALAYIAITGRKRGLHMSTRLAVLDYTNLNLEGPSFYELTEEGWEIAKTSRLWKAHEHLTSLGFVHDTRVRRETPRFVHYHHKDVPERSAWTGKHGRAYWASEGETWASDNSKQFRNG